MNRSLRNSAESLLLLQECGIHTDSQTLDAAIQIAHHDHKFQLAHKDLHKYFDWASKAMREKFPKCPCRACKRSRNEEPES